VVVDLLFFIRNWFEQQQYKLRFKCKKFGILITNTNTLQPIKFSNLQTNSGGQ
jgi:hypothetical protein